MKPHLALIQIRNLRSIRGESFPLSDFTALVGGNNAGKTNILLAISWLLRSAPMDRQYFRSTRKPVEVTGTIAGLDPALLQEEKLRPLRDYIDSEGRMVIARRQERPDRRVGSDQLFFYHPARGQGTAHWKEDAAAAEALAQIFPRPLLVPATQDAGNVFSDLFRIRPGDITSHLVAEIVAPYAEKWREP